MLSCCKISAKDKIYFYVMLLDAHERKSRRGLAQIFAKIPGGGVKIARGSPMLGFIAFLLASFSKICLGVLFHPPYASPLVHLCLYSAR